jgi:hypothetical protein
VEAPLADSVPEETAILAVEAWVVRTAKNVPARASVKPAATVAV